MTTLTITHTHLEGTLIEGTSRGDGSADALKANRWRWSRNLGSWYIRGSRDHDARTWQIDTTATQLREAGFTVEVDIDNTPRATADVESDRVERAAQRADALDAKSQRLQAASDARFATADGISESIPFGQPILVGHHSEARARRGAEKINTNMRAGIDAQNAARDAQRRANSARANTRPEHPSTTANRLDKLRAELRRIDRSRAIDRGRATREAAPLSDAQEGRYAEQTAHLREQITYWEGVRAEQIEQGRIADTSSVEVGDLVNVHGSDWWRVKRVNAKTFTVTYGHSQVRVPHHQVTAVRTADGHPKHP
ncbi:DUF3560 domain-containing protein [Brachybacterium kimchii]|uniref:DUF3560 domain-containing protein n=1 Tax=Brachybacterium kimchii TaxID=2942909 RepID=A0ABY4NCY4_9MICO|nr:DUF3560 domain-containing protein [Brachybacterium kimchii]UQN31792.1 DUF3560 domain-containing protein [Brachybacterium kimchii]